MEHTSEQLDIIRRMGETSKKFDTAFNNLKSYINNSQDSVRVAGESLAASLATIGGALLRANERLAQVSLLSNEVAKANKEHGDLFREYLDTIIKRGEDEQER